MANLVLLLGVGNGFFIDESADPIVLVARGTGIAPLYALGEEVHNKNRERNIFILMGARTGERIFYEAECERLGDVHLYTDDGSRGFMGTAPRLLSNLAKEKTIPERFILYACGPGQMLKELARLSRELRVEGQVVLEERMGCGTGICYGCAVKSAKSDHYIRFCTEGPVLNLKDVEF